MHVDAAVLADDAAAGQAYLEEGAALHGSDLRRMLCEATVVTMLERDREVLGVGRRRRLATRAQRRALLRRDGGCARPGCAESRIERLHAHHIRHWLLGGGTDMSNLVLLCDVDHRLVHELGLVMMRRGRTLVVVAADGRRVWGTADGAFVDGVRGVTGDATSGRFVGVQPIDELAARRPSASGPVPIPAIRPQAQPAGIATLLFPDDPPRLVDAMKVNGERMDLTHVVALLMGNRDPERRRVAEARGSALVAASSRTI